MTNREKDWLRTYVRFLVKNKYSNAEIIMGVMMNGFSKTTAINYINVENERRKK